MAPRRAPQDPPPPASHVPSPRRPRRRLPLPLPLFLLFPLLLVTGCRGGVEGELSGYRVEVALAPTPPVVGPNRVALTLRDPQGSPVTEASVRLEGTMTHAGMVPVFGDATEQGEGRYAVDAFGFTMGGDWILRVHVTLADGRSGVLERSTRVVSTGPSTELPSEDEGGGPTGP